MQAVKGLNSMAQDLNFKMRNIEIIANNIANINTTGYKREIPFADYLARYENSGLKQLTDFSEGAFSQTGNPLDLAISGNGFFMIQTKKGVELTKDGQFKISNDGFLVTQSGNNVLGNSGPINLSQILLGKNKNIAITKNGELRIGKEIVGRLLIGKLKNQRGLERVSGQKFYLPQQDYVLANENDFKIRQGFLEESNSNPILEMQAMITYEKEFQTAQKIVRTLDRIMGDSKEIGKV